jgi:hypothetical protein
MFVYTDQVMYHQYMSAFTLTVVYGPSRATRIRRLFLATYAILNPTMTPFGCSSGTST